MDLLSDNTKRIIAIDYGEKRIGIAISDPLQLFAIPLKTISNNKNVWKELGAIFKEYNVVKTIMGYPLKEDGSKTKISSLVEKFASDFNINVKSKVYFVDERYSSAIAWEHIVKSVKSKKKRRDKGLIDQNAAAVILDDYLRNNK